MNPKNSTVAAALVGGYLLGKTGVAGLAVGAGLFLVGRKMDLDPWRLGRLVVESPTTAALGAQLRREVAEAAKAAAAEALGTWSPSGTLRTSSVPRARKGGGDGDE
ncbi:hypothetical protein [Streptomyces sp. NPDC003327]